MLFGKKRAELAIPVDKEPEKETRSQRKQKFSSRSFVNEPDANDDLFEVLRKTRKQIADENDWPAYVVLSDRTLKELVATPPLSIDDLYSVYGFGERKIEMFGQRFIDAVRDYLGQ